MAKKSLVSPLTFHIVTLFPESLVGYFETSIVGRAIQKKLLKIESYPLRKFAKGKLRKRWPDGNVTTYVDDRPYGGGPGMVLRPEPFLEAVEEIRKKVLKKNSKAKIEIVFFSAGGAQFDNVQANHLAKKYTDIILLCGRYEGIDARVSKLLKAKEVSIGPYVLTGGELPAMIVIDTVSRQVPGILGNFDSVEERRVASHDVYTRPETLVYKNKKYKVPKILTSGHHQKIEGWKKAKTTSHKLTL